MTFMQFYSEPSSCGPYGYGRLKLSFENERVRLLRIPNYRFDDCGSYFGEQKRPTMVGMADPILISRTINVNSYPLGQEKVTRS